MTDFQATEVNPETSELVVRHDKAHPRLVPADRASAGQPASTSRDETGVVDPIRPGASSEPILADAMPVRVAQPEDEDGLIALAWTMHREVGTFSPNENKARAMFRQGWIGDNVITGVIGPVGAPVACIGLMLSDTWCTTDKVLGDFVVFVHPDHRRSGHAKALLRFACHVADRLDVPLTIGVFGDKADNLFEVAFDSNLSSKKDQAELTENARQWKQRLRFYRKQLGEPAGFYFLYNRKWSKPEGEVA